MTKSALGLFLILLVLISSCAKRPNLYTSDEIMTEFKPVYADFEYLSARGRIVLEESYGKTTKGTINIRAKKDSVIWFSITPGLGLEAIRGAVTSDKIQIKDRLGGDDLNMSFFEIEERFGLTLSLSLIENFLYANIPAEFSFRDRLLRVGRYFELTQVREGVKYHSRVSTYHGKVVEMTGEPIDKKGKILTNYKSFENVQDQPFSSEMLLKFSYLMDEAYENATVHMILNRIEFQTQPISFPFQYQ